MEKLNALDSYEKEFYNEIVNCEVNVSDLQRLGVSDKTLKMETVLRSVFGDEFYKRESKDQEVNESEKKVEKLDEKALQFTETIQNICNEMEDTEFDSNLDRLVIKATED